MQSDTGFESTNEQPSVPCCSRTLMDSRLKPSGEMALKCPRCDSTNTKFCYYNNYSLTQPRYFCKACRRYWTKGGSLRNVPVGGGCRKNKRSSRRTSADQNSVFSCLRLNDPSAGSANSPSRSHRNDESVTDPSPDDTDRQNGILPRGPSPVYVSMGNGRYHQHEPGGPVPLQSHRPPLLNLNAFQCLKSACSLFAGLESPHRASSRDAAGGQGAALMNISGDLSSIFELTRQDHQQQVGNAFNEAFNVMAVQGTGLNVPEWQQQHQKQSVTGDNAQVDVMLSFDHRRHNPDTAVKEFRIPADHQRTLRHLAVTTTTMQQPPASNKVYEDNRSGPYNWQAPNPSGSLILNESSAGLNTGYWNTGDSWPDLSCLDIINTEFSS